MVGAAAARALVGSAGQDVCWGVVVVGGGRLVEEDSTLDGFAADGALAHPVPAQLAGAVAAHEDHVLQPVQTDGTHGLQGEGGRDAEQRLASER